MKLLFSISCLAFLGLLIACSGQNGIAGPCADRISYDLVDVNEGIDLEALFSPPDSLELAQVLAAWSDFNPNVGELEIEHQGTFDTDRKQLTVSHLADSLRHYGVIIFPATYDSSQQYPAFVWLAGLNQRDPTNYPFAWSALENMYKKLTNHFIIIPGFRGQNLGFKGRNYCSDGYFGDAYDGATDDALRLLALTSAAYSIDPNKVRVGGASRGGTVALLMAVRDTTIQACISMAGPSNFHNKDGYIRYGGQYRYQFLTERKPMAALRNKMLRCAPVYFIERYRNPVLILHGRKDKIVPLWHAETVVEALAENGNADYVYLDEGHGFNELSRVLMFLQSL